LSFSELYVVDVLNKAISEAEVITLI